MNTNRIASNITKSLAGRARAVVSLALIVVAASGLVLGGLPDLSQASSHREAPFIATDPQADNTDLYAFVSPDQTNTVTIIANYIPLEEPGGGPNFFSFGDDVLYEIKIDNTGNGQADIVYRFDFTTVISPARGLNTFLYNDGPITSIDDDNYLQKQYYSVTRVENGATTTVAGNRLVPPVNIGPRSTPNYETTAMQGVYNMSNGGKVFAGQRDDPFFVDLGSVFDLAGLRPFNPAHLIPLTGTVGIDGVAGYKTHTIAIQVPIADLTRDHQPVTGAGDADAVVGIWATASRPRVRVLQSDGTVGYSGNMVQISRLGNPLINEVIIPFGQKDRWNASTPADDKSFLEYYKSPILAEYVNLLYPPLQDIDTTGRDDLVAVLLTGVPGLNFTGNTKADMLRLNMGVAPVAPGTEKTLGVLEGDLAGFPNGRRLVDDVTDIELRAVAQGYGPVVASLLGLPNKNPNNDVGDGVNRNDRPFKSTFPYVASPWQGYEHDHHAPGSNPTPLPESAGN